jgi:hypothetical protein
MLKTLELVAIVASVILLLSLVGLSYLSSPASSGGHLSEQQTTSQTEDKKQSEEAHSVRGFIRYLFPDGIAVFTFWLVLATIVLGIVAVVQIGFLERAENIATENAKAAKDSADVAKQTLVTANRPWVSAEFKVGSDLTFDTPGANLAFEYVLKNTGNTPGIAVEVYAKLLLIEFGKVTGNPPDVVIQSMTTDPASVLRDLCEMARTIGDAPFPQGIKGDAIFPGGSLPDRVKLQLSTDEIVRAKESSFHKTISPVVVVSVNYKSSLEKLSRQTGYIWHVFTNDPRHGNGIDPIKGNIDRNSLGLTRSFNSSFAN